MRPRRIRGVGDEDMSGIELFLTKQLYGSDQHPRGWDKFVYDDENLHYALLQLLSESSKAFAQKFLGLSVAPTQLSVTLEPERGLFDLLFLADGIPHYCEVKVWAQLSESQFQRQIDFLKPCQAKGIYVLFTKAADIWSPTAVLEKSFGLSRVVGITDLLPMLNSLERELPLDVLEVAAAYKRALLSLNVRWPAAVQRGPA